MKTLQEQLQKGFALLGEGKVLDAEKLAKKILKKSSGNPHALYLMGVCLHKKKRLKDAAEYFHRSYRAAPDNPAALAGMAVVEMDRGRNEQAVDALQKALKLDRDSPPLLNNLALCYRAMGRADEAIRIWMKCIKVAPTVLDSYYNLAESLDLLGRFEEAERAYVAATKINQNNPRSWMLLATFSLKHTKIDDAKAQAQKALELAPNEPKSQAILMRIHAVNGEVQEAVAMAHRILDQVPTHIPAINTLLDLSEPETEAEQAALDQRINDCVRRIEMSDIDLGLIEDRANAEFNKAAFYDKIKKYDEAGAAYLRANAYKMQNLATVGSIYEPHKVDKYVQDTADRLVRGDLERIALGSDDERPVFILGMPRSGTSLMEQILASHPQGDGIGEGIGIQSIVKDLGAGRGIRATIDWWDKVIDNPDSMPAFADAYLKEMERACEKPGALRVADKNPFNFLFTGLILRLFPKATIFWTDRNPEDVGLSIFTQNFASPMVFDNDPKALWHFYSAHDRLRELYREACPDRVKILKYEDLVSEPEKTVAFMLDAIGLEWDDACLSFHKTKRKMATASYKQVRKAISTNSVNRSDRYRPGLAPLFDARQAIVDSETESV